MKKMTFTIIAILLYQLSYTQVLVTRDTIYSEQAQQVQSEQPVEPKPQIKTLFQNQQSFGGYFGLTMGYTQIDGEDAFIAGGRFMFVANHYLGIGFGGKGFMSAPETQPNSNFNHTNLYISNAGGYGGLYLEPVIFSLKPVHVSLPVLLGGGAIVNQVWTNDYYVSNSTTSGFFLVEPGVDIELNITTWFRLGVGASYRFTSNIEGLNDRPNDLMNDFNYAMTFKFGWF